MYTVSKLRKFKVVNCPQEKTVARQKKAINDAGATYTYTVYSTVKAGEKGQNGEVWYPNAYGHRAIKEGDIIELGGRMADKAAANPDFEEVKEAPEKKVTKKAKKKYRKNAAVPNNTA